MISVEAAYARCQEITKVEAKNFSYGIRLLPDDKRDAMSALYAYARRIDDIADSALAVEQKLAGLAEVDAQVERLAAGQLPDADDPDSPVRWNDRWWVIGPGRRTYTAASADEVEALDAIRNERDVEPTAAE